MRWHDHSRDLRRAGDHALFSASKYSWIRDRSQDEAMQRYYSTFAQVIGTVVHERAAKAIRTHTRYTKSEAKKVLREELLTFQGHVDEHNGNWIPYIPPKAYSISDLAENYVNYVNDAIGYMMKAEVPLWYSDVAFGTADALYFDEKKRILRIHDLKTGITPAKFDQLEVYAAFYCLDFDVRPEDIIFELRIYQGGEVIVEKPEADAIIPIIESVKWHSDLILNSRED